MACARTCPDLLGSAEFRAGSCRSAARCSHEARHWHSRKVSLGCFRKRLRPRSTVLNSGRTSPVHGLPALRPTRSPSLARPSQAAVTATAAAASSAPDAASYARLVEWAQQKSGLGASLAQRWAVEPRSGGPEQGWGLFAVRGAGAQDPVLLVPQSLALSATQAKNTTELAPLSNALSPWALLALLLLVEKAKGVESEWEPYIRTLPGPQALNSPLLWSDEELAELEGSQVLGSVFQYKEVVAEQFQALREALGVPEGAGAVSVGPAQVDLPALTWAFATLRARCFPPCRGEAIALVPLLDLVNHGFAPGKAEWVASTLPAGAASSEGGLLGGLIKGLQSSQPAYALLPGQSVKEGTQVLVNYGDDKSHGDLLLEYGFVEAPPVLGSGGTGADRSSFLRDDWFGGAARGSPEAVAEARRKAEKDKWGDAGAAAAASAWERRQVYLLSLEIPPSERFLDDKLDILDLAGLSSPYTFELRLAQPVPDDLLAFLRLAALSGPDSFHLEALFRNEAWDRLLFPISQENEEAVCRTMIEGCRGALSAYTTTETEDELLLAQAGEVSPRKLMAVTVRRSEKQVLGAILASFESRLQSLNSLEYFGDRRLRDLGLLDEKGNMTPWATAE